MLLRDMLQQVVREQEEEGWFSGVVWVQRGDEVLLAEAVGWIVRWGHAGEEDGVSGRLFYYPRVDVDVIILGNQNWCAGKLGWVVHDLLQERFYGE